MFNEWFNIVCDSLPQLLYATFAFTIPIAIIAFFFSVIIGLFISIIKIFVKKKIVFIIHLYVWIFRGTPLLVTLFFIFYGLPTIGIVFNSFTSIIISLTLCYSSYISEIIRSSIIAIPKGQWDASYSIGLTWRQSMRHVILPQAALTSAAPLSNEFISLLKSTALASSVALPEIFQIGQRIISVTYQPLIVYIEIALIYLVLTSLCYLLQIKMENFTKRYTHTR